MRETPGSRVHRGLVAAGSLATGLVILALLFGGSSGPSAQSVGPSGTLALRRLLENVGHEVIDGDAPQPGETFVLLSDRRDQPTAEPVLRWVARGGLLILADPRSRMLGLILVSTRGPAAPSGSGGTQTLPADCVLAEALGVDTIEVGASDLAVWPDYLRQPSCFNGPSGPYAVTTTFGQGTVVVLGGRSPFENALLDRADNAAFAAGLVASRHVVRFGSVRGTPPATPSQSGSVWGALPTAIKVLLIQLALAAAAFALVRARRLGRPVEETPISPIPAGELVRATSRLYRKGRATDFSGSLLRTAAEGAVRRRLGLPRGVSAERVADEAARATGRESNELLELLEDSPLKNDDDLIQLGRDLEELMRTVETATR
jgi:hypothetical protein